MGEWVVTEPRQIALDGALDSLDVKLISGRVNVVATDGPARVDVTRVGTAPVVVEHERGRLAIRHQRPPRVVGFLRWIVSFRRRFRVDVSVAVPAHLVADVRLIEGAIVAAGLRESTEVSLTSGRITLMGLGGRTRARIVSGPIEALGVAGDLGMKTTAGELILADSPADRVEASTVSGSITCDLDNPRHSEIRLGTTSGSVTVRVREDSSLAVDLHTQSGHVTSSFPQVPRSWTGGPRRSTGVLGSGAGKLFVSTVSGSIALLARPVDDGTDERGESPA